MRNCDLLASESPLVINSQVNIYSWPKAATHFHLSEKPVLPVATMSPACEMWSSTAQYCFCRDSLFVCLQWWRFRLFFFQFEVPVLRILRFQACGLSLFSTSVFPSFLFVFLFPLSFVCSILGTDCCHVNSWLWSLMWEHMLIQLTSLIQVVFSDLEFF